MEEKYVAVWRYMIATHNLDYSCVVTGSSVHNERVDRLWRDVHRCIASDFADTFRILERNGHLDPLNEVDMYCLHHIFGPRINKCISECKESCNHHALSTEGNKTPYQLFFEGLNHECGSAIASSGNTDTDIDLTQDRVSIPRVKFVPCPSLQHQLCIINPLQSCSGNGGTLYIRAIQAAGQHLSSHCTLCVILQ